MRRSRMRTSRGKHEAGAIAADAIAFNPVVKLKTKAEARPAVGAAPAICITCRSPTTTTTSSGSGSLADEPKLIPLIEEETHTIFLIYDRLRLETLAWIDSGIGLGFVRPASTSLLLL